MHLLLLNSRWQSPIINSLENDIFLSTGKGDLQDTGNLTYKELWNIKKLSDQFKQSNYKKYKRRCFLQRKLK